MKNKFQNPYYIYLISGFIFGALFITLLCRGIVLLESLQKITVDIVLTLSVSFISSLLSVFSGFVSRITRNEQKLWNLAEPTNCAICVSAHQWRQKLADGRERERSSVSEGQIIALPHILSSLHKAYGDAFPWTKIYNSHTPQAAAAFANGEDLILIGGSVTNPQTGGAFALVDERVHIHYTHEHLDVKVGRGAIGGEYHYDIERNGTIHDSIYEVTKDYAIILHVTVRGAERARKIVVIAGCTTLGTGAAGQFFCSQMVNNEQWKMRGSEDYVAILSCPYVNQRPDMENTRVEAFINI